MINTCMCNIICAFIYSIPVGVVGKDDDDTVGITSRVVKVELIKSLKVTESMAIVPILLCVLDL